MITIKVGTVKSQISGVFPTGVRKEIRSQLSYNVKDSYFIKQNSKKDLSWWDGKKYLINAQNIFYTGFLPRVRKILDDLYCPYIVHDERGYSVDHLPFQLRDYQEVALVTIFQEKRGILYMVPRSGKTIVDIAATLILRPYPKIFFCRSLDIAYQTIDKYKKFAPLVDVGLIGDGQVDIKDVTLITIQSAISSYGEKYKWKRDEKKEKPIKKKEKEVVQSLISKARFVTYDEVHHVGSTAGIFIFDKILSAEYVLGLSGTPWREDNTDLLLEGLVGPIIYEASYSLLIEKGYLVAPTIYFISVPPMAFPKKPAYSLVYKDYVVENTVRNTYIRRAAIGLEGKGHLVLIIVREKKHGRILNEMIPNSVWLYGDDKTDKRNKVWKDFEDGKIKILITTLADEGMDIPRLSVVINAAGGRSSILAHQRLRMLTPFEGKEKAIFVDFLDDAPFLLKHSKRKLKLYESEKKFTVRIKEDF